MAFDQLVTLAQLQQQVRFWADMPDPGRPTDAELVTLINLMTKRLYGRLVTLYEDYFVSTSPNLNIPGGSDNLDLATVITAGPGGSSDFWKLIGVDAWDGSRFWPLKPFQIRERDRVDPVTSLPMRYQLRGSRLYFLPSPPPVATVRLLYVPRLAALAAPGDTLDGWNGWEEVAVLRAAMVLRARDEEPLTDLKQELDRVTAELMAEAKDRDLTGTRKVADVRGWGGE